MRRRDDEATALPRARDDVLLRCRDLFDRDLDAEITARHHDPVGVLENVVEVVECARPLELRNDAQIRPGAL